MSRDSPVEFDAVADYFRELQSEICAGLSRLEGAAPFIADPQVHPGGGLSRPMLCQGGEVIEKAAVNFTRSHGDSLPSAATARKPERAGCGFQAAAISLIVHPRNPYAPTTHANLRVFVVTRDGQANDWWFGGGFDLTPFYGFEEDAIHWHTEARAACAPFGEALYGELKAECDRYFYLPHRDEPRGIGGLFFDDWRRGGFAESFRFVRSVGDHFLPAYLPILVRRKDTPYGESERDWQLCRRGRYVEFNLVYDRGTKYGLQSGRRTETVLASMPPEVRWYYQRTPEPGSPEARLMTEFLSPREWLS